MVSQGNEYSYSIKSIKLSSDKKANVPVKKQNTSGSYARLAEVYTPSGHGETQRA